MVSKTVIFTDGMSMLDTVILKHQINWAKSMPTDEREAMYWELREDQDIGDWMDACDREIGASPHPSHAIRPEHV